jgi:hypothetical protein
MRAQELQCGGGAHVRVQVHGSEIRSARDGTGQQLRSGKMAGTRMQNAMVGACRAVRARCDAPATPDCLMARMVPSKP